jgi:hypothetical protein
MPRHTLGEHIARGGTGPEALSPTLHTNPMREQLAREYMDPQTLSDTMPQHTLGEQIAMGGMGTTVLSHTLHTNPGCVTSLLHCDCKCCMDFVVHLVIAMECAIGFAFGIALRFAYGVCG